MREDEPVMHQDEFYELTQNLQCVSAFPKKLHTFAKMIHFSIKVNFLDFDRLHKNRHYFIRHYTHLRR